MRIKLANEQSRRRTQQLKSRLKLLASDLHGEERHKISNVSQLSSGLAGGQPKKNYFKSTTNLNVHHNHNQLRTSSINDYGQDYQAMGPSSPKFSTSPNYNHNHFTIPHQSNNQLNSPKLRYSSSGSQLVQTQKETKTKQEFKVIIQSKKEFHSLIKKELSELEKLEQMMIEQPQNWNDQGNEDCSYYEMSNLRHNGLVKPTNHNPQQQTYHSNEQQTKSMNQAGPNFSQQLSKTKTEQSMQQSMGHQNHSHTHTNPTSQPKIRSNSQQPEHSVSLSQQSPQFHQEAPGQTQNSISSIVKYDEEESSMRFDRRKAEELLRQMMIVDYSEENIQSILRLVEEESIRKSKRNSLNNSKKNSLSSSILPVSQNPSLISQSSANSNFSNRHSSINRSVNPLTIMAGNQDHIKQNDLEKVHIEEEKHYQLIHSYKLFSLVLKIKHFASLKNLLSKSLFSRRHLEHYYKYHNIQLLSKSFTAIISHAKQSAQQQNMLFKIKNIYTHNMLKKSALKQIIFNAKYKTFKFLSTKLSYQQQLKAKSRALAILLTRRHQQGKYHEITKLKDETNKKSMFKMVKQRHLGTRETQAKYRLLKNLVKHRHWNSFVRVVRFDWVKDVVSRNEQNAEIQLKIKNKHVSEYQESDSSEGICPSSSVEQMIIWGLNSYSELFTSHMSQLKPSSFYSQIQRSCGVQNSINSSIQQSEAVMEFSEPIVLHLKKSILAKYLTEKLKRYTIDRFVEFSASQRQRSERKCQIQRRLQQIVEKFILRNKKAQFLQKFKDDFLTNKIQQKLCYFCNMTIGKVPLSFKSNSIADQSQQTQQQTNPLMVNYYKHTFICRMKQFAFRQNKTKLQKQVYYDTIYGSNLIRRQFIQWKTISQSLKAQKSRQFELKKQAQQNIQNQKEHQLVESETLKKQQLLLQQQQQKVKQHQIHLKRAEQRLKQQQIHLQQRQHEIKTKLTQLNQQEEHLSRLQHSKIQQLKAEAQTLLQQKQKLHLQAEHQRALFLQEENEMKQRLEKLREEEQIGKRRLKQMEEMVEMKKRHQTDHKKQQFICLQQANQLEKSVDNTIIKHSPSQHNQLQLAVPSYREQNQESSLLSKSQSHHYQIEQSYVSNEDPTSVQSLKVQQIIQSSHHQSSHQIQPIDSRIQQQQSLQLKQEEQVQVSHFQSSNHYQQKNSEDEDEEYLQSEGNSEQSEQILADYITQRTRLAKNQSSHQGSFVQLQEQPKEKSSVLNGLNSSLKMDDMMDWLGNKIGIKQPLDYCVEQSQQSFQYPQDSVSAHQQSRVPVNQQAQDDLNQSSDQLFANMLIPKKYSPHSSQSPTSSKLQQSKTPSHLDKSNTSNIHQSVKIPSKSISSPRQQDPYQQESQQQPQSSSQSSEQHTDHLSEPESHSQDLSSSKSQSHLRLLTYAQNHNQKYITHLIFNKVFKQKSYKQQQNHERTLLATIFTNWKSFYMQKKSLKKYLDIYEKIEARINQQNEDLRQKIKREPRSLSRERHNQDTKRYMLGSKTNEVQRQKDQLMTLQEQRIKPKLLQQGIKYYATSKQQKQEFQNLYK